MIVIRNSVLVFVVILSSRVLFADGKPWTMEAIMALKTISDPQISSGRLQGGLRDSQRQLPAQGYDSQIWVVSTAGGTPQPLKSSHVSDARPRWSRNGQSAGIRFTPGWSLHRSTWSQRQTGNPES